MLAALVAAMGWIAAQNVAAQPVAGVASMSVTGNWYPKPRKNHVNWYAYSSALGAPGPEADNAGGAAAFGWFDSGEVQLLSYAEHMPSVRGGFVTRKLTPSSRLGLEGLPRYVMVCSWVTEDGRPTGARYAGFAERNDANATDEYDSLTRYHQLSARWDSVPAKRAEGKFADRDYCDEIARTRASFVAEWLPGKKKN